MPEFIQIEVLDAVPEGWYTAEQMRIMLNLKVSTEKSYIRKHGVKPRKIILKGRNVAVNIFSEDHLRQLLETRREKAGRLRPYIRVKDILKEVHVDPD